MRARALAILNIGLLLAGCSNSGSAFAVGGGGGAGSAGSSVDGTSEESAGTGMSGSAAAAGMPAANGGSRSDDVGMAGSPGGAAGSSALEAGSVSRVNSDPAYMNLAPPMGARLDGVGKQLTPPAPDGWVWYDVEGAICRDGSPTGFYVHTGTDSRLLIYLEGGGACSNDHFCAFNPPNVDTVLAGDGQTVIGTTLGAIPGRQQPGVYTRAGHDGDPAGIFELSNAANPFKDWSQIYIPYCTGDVFFGTKRDASVPGLANQQFVGHLNMKLFMSRIVPTFKAKVSRVILTGASAGGFGAALNFSMVQDSFGNVPVDVIDDSGPPFADKFMPVCMQKRWREQWGFEASLPPDCADCRQADGGGLINLSTFLLKKHPHAHLAMISGMQDEVIRLFYSVGLKDCADYDTADPVAITLGQLLDPTVLMAAETYAEGLNDLRARYQGTGRLATFYVGGSDPNLHQHMFRPEFYTGDFGDLTQFVTDFLNGKVEQVGPQPAP